MSERLLNTGLVGTAHRDPVVMGIFRNAECINDASRREGGRDCLVVNSVTDLNNTWRQRGYLGRTVRHHGSLLPLTHNVRAISPNGVLELDPQAFENEDWSEAVGVSKGFVAVERPASKDLLTSTGPYIMHRFTTEDGLEFATHVSGLEKGAIEFPGFMSQVQARAFVKAYDPKTVVLIEEWKNSGLDDAVTTLRRVDLGMYCDGRVGDDYLVAVNTILQHTRKLTFGTRFEGVVKGMAYTTNTTQVSVSDVYFASDDIAVDSVGALVYAVVDDYGNEDTLCEVALGIDAKLSDGTRQRFAVPVSSLKRFEVAAIA